MTGETVGLLLVADDGPTKGLGHLRRMQFLERELLRSSGLTVNLVSRESFVDGSRQTMSNTEFSLRVAQAISKLRPSICVFDLKYPAWEADWNQLEARLPPSTLTVGIDVPLDWADRFSETIHPCVSPPLPTDLAKKSHWGPRWVLLDRSPKWKPLQGSKVITVVTGSQGFDDYFETIRRPIEALARNGANVSWVVGAYREQRISTLNRADSRIRFVSDRSLANRLATSNIVIARFGVTVLELAARGVPTIVLPGWSESEREEVTRLDEVGAILLCENRDTLAEESMELLSNQNKQQELSDRAIKFFELNGCHPASSFFAGLASRGKDHSHN